MTTMWITRGAPGSGKTTWALTQIDAEVAHPTVRVNRDDLRRELFPERGQDYYAAPDFRDRENRITEVQHRRVSALLEAHVDVIVDDTNLPVRRCRELMRLAEEVGADFGVVDFSDVSLEECIARQAGRPADERVPAVVIEGMYNKYVRGGLAPLPATSGLSAATHDYSSVVPVTEVRTTQLGDPLRELHTAVVVDIDGTVARMNGRGPHDYHLVDTDLPIWDVIELVHDLSRAGHEIIFLSGRRDDCRQQTEEWLDTYFTRPYEMLLMRPAGDTRTDWIVKYELFNEHIRDKYNVVGVFDDRDQVVKMWRALGLTCYQCAPGDF